MRLRRALAVIAGAFIAFAAVAVDPPPSARSFDELITRDGTYTRVTIIDISKTHVSFRSAQGFATVRLAELDATVQTRLAGGSVDLATTKKSPGNAKESPGGKEAKTVKAREKTDAEEGDATDESEECGLTIEWTPRNIAGVSVLGIGALAVLIGHIWFICAGFHTSVLWGICLLIGGIVLDIMFCVGHWEVAKRPLFIQLGGFAILFGGWKLLAL